MFAESTVKLLLSTGALGGIFYTVVAATTDLPLPPLPTASETQTALNILLLALSGYIVKMLKEQNKKDPHTDSQIRRNPPTGSSFSEIILARLERLAYATNEEVKNHRIEFSNFRGEVNTEFAEIKGRVDNLERKTNTGETKRP